MITMSRWPKFMAWKHPTIAKNCETVFYLDASARPDPKLALDMRSSLLNMYDGLMDSTIGFSMPIHPKVRKVP